MVSEFRIQWQKTMEEDLSTIIQVYQIQSSIARLRRETMSILSRFAQIKGLWDELSSTAVVVP